jgi:hypothetical protein
MPILFVGSPIAQISGRSSEDCKVGFASRQSILLTEKYLKDGTSACDFEKPTVNKIRALKNMNF